MPSEPSQAATYVALTAVSVVIGYLAGVGSSLQITRSETPAPNVYAEEKHKEDKDEESDESNSEISDSQEVSSVTVNASEDCKLALVVRTDLGMTSGKIAAQCSHATLACYKALNKANPTLLRHWERTGQTKVALRGGDEEELDTLEALAKSLNLCTRSIHDAGRTQIAAGSRTVLGIGPGPSRLVNQVTSKLKLL